MAVTAADFDLIENGDITASIAIPHATVQAVASGEGREYYAVEVGAGDRLIFDIDQGSFDTTIELFDAAGNAIAFNDDNDSDPGSLGYNSFLDYTVSQGGTYYLAVGAYSGLPPASASYTLHISIEDLA